MGRPTKLDETTTKAILAALAVGTPVGSACKAAGIGTTTFKAWMARGRSDKPADAPFRAFRSSVKKARASAQVHALAMIRRAMSDHWQAAAWYLERTDPRRWGRKAVPVEAPTPHQPIAIRIIRNALNCDPARFDRPPSSTQPAPMAREDRPAKPVRVLPDGSTETDWLP